MPVLVSGWLRGQVVPSGRPSFDVSPVVAVLGASAGLVQRAGVAFLIDGVGRIEQLVEVEILKNFPRLLLILLRLEVLVVHDIHLAIAPALLIRADALAHEAIVLRSAVEFGIPDQVLQAVLAAVAVSLVAARARISTAVVISFSGLLFEIWAAALFIAALQIVTLAQNELPIDGV